jgi:type VI secretion system secreted protein Hcp
MAQVDYFLKIDGVPGESTDSKHKGEIEIQSFSWGESNMGSAGHGGGGGSGKVVPQDLSISKRMDKSSPVLFISCATGSHFKDAVLTARKAGAGGQQEYLKITMEEVLVTNYQVSGADGSDNIPNESLTLNFAKLEVSYKPQNPDGTLGAEVKQKYDFSQNVKV